MSTIDFFASLHPFIKGLVRELPLPGASWPVGEREKWLHAAEACFDLLYKPEPNGEGQKEKEASP